MPKVSSKKFFQEQTTHSRVKALLIHKFVLAWLQVVLSTQRKYGKSEIAAYVDLFAGPGSYEDGSRSTPLLILESVLRKPSFSRGLRSYFNDSEPALIESLKQEIDTLPGIQDLAMKPVYTAQAASITLINDFGISKEVPQFFFLDQFGWADIKPELIRRIFSAKMCDCAFFLRTSRMIAAVTNPTSEVTMLAIFGQQRLAHLQKEFSVRRVDKEDILLRELQLVIKEAGALYFQPFPFRIREERSSKHHLIYLGKHERGLSIMKDIMGKTSSTHHNGVPVMGYFETLAEPSLFSADPLAELQLALLKTFAGKVLTVGEIYLLHHPSSSRFILRNYQEALRRLEYDNIVSVKPISSIRPKRNGVVSMSEFVEITFPLKGGTK